MRLDNYQRENQSKNSHSHINHNCNYMLPVNGQENENYKSYYNHSYY